MIEFENLHKSFGKQKVLRGISLKVRRGTVHFIIGASGAGKSVLIKQLVGLLRPDAGRIHFDGQDVTELDEQGFFAIRRRCQMIFQHATLFDALTMAENVAMPIRKRFNVSRAEALESAERALELVHARDMAHRLPSELGAGLKKRVAIARAIALQPEVLLYDEPTTSLDPVAARRIDRLIRRTADELQMTSVVVSHDLRSVRDVGDTVTYLKQGRVGFEGTPDELFSSTDPDLDAFVDASGLR